MSTDNIAGELTQVNEHLGDIANALHKLVALGERPQTFGDLVDSLPDPACPECEPCVDMEHQKGYK
tara:strand:- start:193 stop:390 length:198 start_codon:yes stop_codon:yes gene_type:complete